MARICAKRFGRVRQCRAHPRRRQASGGPSALMEAGQVRTPWLTSWARPTFEQGCLSAPPHLEGSCKALSVPGEHLFQASRIRPHSERRHVCLLAIGFRVLRCLRHAVSPGFADSHSSARTRVLSSNWVSVSTNVRSCGLKSLLPHLPSPSRSRTWRGPRSS